MRKPGLSLLHRYLLSPGITWLLLHQSVDRSFEQLPFGQILRSPSLLLKIVCGAPLMVLDAFRFAVGDLPVGLAMAALGGMFWVLERTSAPSGLARPQLVFAAIGSLLVAMYLLMLVRADYLVSSEHRRFLYCLPSSAVWLLLTAFVLSRLPLTGILPARMVEITLVLLVISNVFAIQEHRFVLRHGYYGAAMTQGAELQRMLEPSALSDAAGGQDKTRLRERFKDAMARPAEFSGPLEESPLYLYFVARTAGVNL